MNELIDLTPIVEMAIALAVALVTTFLIPWIKSKTTAAQREMMVAVTRTLGYAAEQLYGAGKGEEKLDYVIRQLEDRGYTADRAAIEAMVKEEFNRFREKKETEDKPPDQV